MIYPSLVEEEIGTVKLQVRSEIVFRNLWVEKFLRDRLLILGEFPKNSTFIPWRNFRLLLNKNKFSRNISDWKMKNKINKIPQQDDAEISKRQRILHHTCSHYLLRRHFGFNKDFTFNKCIKRKLSASPRSCQKPFFSHPIPHDILAKKKDYGPRRSLTKVFRKKKMKNRLLFNVVEGSSRANKKLY